MVIFVNYEDNNDTTTTAANNSMGFDLSAIQSCLYLCHFMSLSICLFLYVSVSHLLCLCLFHFVSVSLYLYLCGIISLCLCLLVSLSPFCLSFSLFLSLHRRIYQNFVPVYQGSPENSLAESILGFIGGPGESRRGMLTNINYCYQVIISFDNKW